MSELSSDGNESQIIRTGLRELSASPNQVIVW